MNKPFAPMQATKWLKVQLLISGSEMASLIKALGSFDIYIAGAVTIKGGGRTTQEQFIKTYHSYADALEQGKLPKDADYRPLFSAVFTKDPNSIYTVPVGTDRQLWRIARPVIQLQPHSLDYSTHDGKFRPMVFGSESILWGLQFSYPQLFQDPATKEVYNVNENPSFPNTELFKNLQRWIRSQTIPTPFLVDEHKINVPMRLGKRCLRWINQHPQLLHRHIQVIVP